MAISDTTAKLDEVLVQLRADIATCEQQIGHDVARIAQLLEDDVPAYLVREAKRRFLAAPAFAEAMAPEVLARLKQELHDEGQRLGASIAQDLADPARWLLEIDEATSALELRDFPQVWGRMAQVATALDTVLGRYAFPSDNNKPGVEYQPPTWFVGGALLKTLLESLHARLLERTRLQRAVHARESERRQKALELKWEGPP